MNYIRFVVLSARPNIVTDMIVVWCIEMLTEYSIKCFVVFSARALYLSIDCIEMKGPDLTRTLWFVVFSARLIMF